MTSAFLQVRNLTYVVVVIVVFFGVCFFFSFLSHFVVPLGISPENLITFPQENLAAKAVLTDLLRVCEA